MLDENQANSFRASNAFVAEEQAPLGSEPTEMAQAFKTAPTRIESRPTGPLVADRGANSCLPPAPLRIRLDDADGPTNARAGGIRLVEGKARTEFDPYPSFPLSSRK
jgi:hypothetical protein